MKKTLLVAAATLAVGTLASQAQVYSQNIVGYINLTVPAGGYSAIGNQLINGSDSSQTNNDIQASLVNGQYVSDPTGANLGTALYVWTGAGYTIYNYYNATDAAANCYTDDTYSTPGNQAGWYNGYIWVSGVSLNQGAGAFLLNGASTNITVTLVGAVPQGTNKISIVPGYNMVSIPEPIAADVNTLGFVGTSDPTGANAGTALYVWTGAGYTIYNYYNATDAAANCYTDDTYSTPGNTAGWYSGYIYANVPAAVGSSFFIDEPSASYTWTNSFTVN